MYVSGFAIKIPAGNLLAVSIYMGFKESGQQLARAFLASLIHNRITHCRY